MIHISNPVRWFATLVAVATLGTATAAVAQSITAPMVVQGPDGTLYLVVDGTKHVLVPQQVGEDQLNTWQDGEALGDGALPIATGPSVPAPTAATSQPQLAVEGLNTIHGPGPFAGDDMVWILGEVRNTGSTPAFNVSVSGRLLAGDGSVAAANSASFDYLPANQSVGFVVSIANPGPFVRAEATVAGTGSSSSDDYRQLSTSDTMFRKTQDTRSTPPADTARYSGMVTNTSDRALYLNQLYVWFLNGEGKVIWAYADAQAHPMPPGASDRFYVDALASRENPMASSITEGRVYAFGRVAR